MNVLSRAVNDPAMEVRRNAAEAIGRLGIASGESILKKILENPEEDRWVKEVAGEAFHRMKSSKD